MKQLLAVLALVVSALLPSLAQAQQISCESRDYRRQYCPIGARVVSAQIFSQTSSSPCIQGRTWGYDGGGVWVVNGCAGIFQYRVAGPPGPIPPLAGNMIPCESRDYRRAFCPSPMRITRAQISQQRSSAPCIQGRSWGWQSDGVWVSQGCSGIFAVEGGGRPPPGPPPGPPPADRISCESRNYQESFCGAGGRVVHAYLERQRSEAACIQGRTWGFRGNGIWVTQGCSGVFRVDYR